MKFFEKLLTFKRYAWYNFILVEALVEKLKGPPDAFECLYLHASSSVTFCHERVRLLFKKILI